MAAMIWDEQAQAYTESETPMKYDSLAGAWTDTTGLAWDPEAEAWTERWGTKVSAYVYGAASETITIRKDGIIVATVQTDSSGCSTEMVSIDPGTYDMTGSVSEWTEEQTVDENTDRFRAMPEGALYWYGNECAWVTGGYVNEKIQHTTVNNNLTGEYTPYTNYFKLTINSASMSVWTTNELRTINNIDLQACSKINVVGHLTYAANITGVFISAGKNNNPVYSPNVILYKIEPLSTYGEMDINDSSDISSLEKNDTPIRICVGNGSNNYNSQLIIRGVWLE